MEQNELLSLLEKTLKYVGIVYNQSLYTTNQNASGTEYVLEYKHTDLPEDGLLFFVPAISSTGPSTLKIKIPTSKDQYASRDFEILVETNNGLTRKVKRNDIIARRMCIFRFRKGTDQIVLCNSPLYDDALFSSLRVTDCTFVNKPTLVNQENTEKIITLATSEDVASLEERIKALEDKIIYGIEDPETVLADKPSGTIYIQVEKES